MDSIPDAKAPPIDEVGAELEKAIIASAEAARKAGVPEKDYKELLEKTVREIFEPILQNDPIVKEYREDPVKFEETYEKMRTVEAEYQSVTQLLIDAKLMDETRRWVDGKRPKEDSLSPDLQRAVVRYDASVEAAKKIGIFERDQELPPTVWENIKKVSKHLAHMTVRSPVAEDSTFRWIMNSKMDIDVKLYIVMLMAPVMVSLVVATRTVPATKAAAVMIKNSIAALDTMEMQLKGYAQLREEAERVDARCRVPEMADLKLLTEFPESMVKSWVTTPEELKEAIDAEKAAGNWVEEDKAEVGIGEKKVASWGMSSADLEKMIAAERLKVVNEKVKAAARSI